MQKEGSPQFNKIVIEEIRQRVEATETAPVPYDIDLVWSISGPGSVLEPPANGLYAGRLTDKERVDHAIAIVITVTAAKLNKDLDEVTREDIEKHGPYLYYNGESQGQGQYAQNEALLLWAQATDFPLPFSHVIISQLAEIYTPGQIKDLIKYLEEHPEIKKIAVVTHVAHERRVSRYLAHYLHLFPQGIQFLGYPVKETIVPEPAIADEAEKIRRYAQKGDLAADPLF